MAVDEPTQPAKPDRTDGDAVVETVEDGEVQGTVRIAPAVLIELIELTVQDAPGVVGFHARRRGDRVRARTETQDGEQAPRVFERGGVRVTVRGSQLDADIAIDVKQGTNVRELGRAIQRRVGVAAQRMLGLSVGEVNVHVADIELTSDQRG
jgi:uncharacterized alkaline shock family protein YloU